MIRFSNAFKQALLERISTRCLSQGAQRISISAKNGFSTVVRFGDRDRSSGFRLPFFFRQFQYPQINASLYDTILPSHS